MKNKSAVITIIALVAIILLGLFLSQKSKEGDAAQIKNIQEKVELINNEKDYQVKTLNNEQVQSEQRTDGGAQLTGYFKDGKISKIKEWLGLSYGVKTYEYYFFDGELILVYEKDENFPDLENTGTLDYTKLELSFEGQYYFENEKLIDTQSTGIKRFPQGEDVDMEDFLLKAAQENIELLTKK